MLPAELLDRSTVKGRMWVTLGYARVRLLDGVEKARSDRSLATAVLRTSLAVQLAVFLVLGVVYLPVHPGRFLEASLAVLAISIPLVILLLIGAGLFVATSKPTRLGWANRLTIARFMTVAPLVWLVGDGRFTSALVVYGACLITDVLDGVVARRRQEQTAFGVIMDPLADIATTAALYGAFWAQGLVPVWVWVILLIRYASLFVGAAALFLAFGPLRLRATLVSKIVGVLQGAAGIMILALAGSGTQWQGNIGVTLFPFLGIIFGSVILSQAIIALRTVKDGANARS